MKIQSDARSQSTKPFIKRLVFAWLLISSSLTYSNSQIVVDAAGHAVGYWVDQSGICNSASTLPVYSFNGYLACFLDTGKADYSPQPPGTFGPVRERRQMTFKLSSLSAKTTAVPGA